MVRSNTTLGMTNKAAGLQVPKASGSCGPRPVLSRVSKQDPDVTPLSRASRSKGARSKTLKPALVLQDATVDEATFAETVPLSSTIKPDCSHAHEVSLEMARDEVAEAEARLKVVQLESTMAVKENHENSTRATARAKVVSKKSKRSSSCSNLRAREKPREKRERTPSCSSSSSRP